MFEGLEVTVIVPAYRESARVARVVRTMPPLVDRVVVVDDASDDGTADEAEREAARTHDGRVSVLRQADNRGVGAAIARGYAHALGEPGDAFVVMAGDGQMDPRCLPSVLRPLARREADYVVGARATPHEVDVAMPRGRRVGRAVFSWLTSLAIRQRVGDSQSGYTAITRAAAEGLDLDGLWPRYGYPNDLLGQLAARGHRVVEAPIRPVYAGEASGLGLAQLPRIGWLIARAAYRVRRARPSTRD